MGSLGGTAGADTSGEAGERAFVSGRRSISVFEGGDGASGMGVSGPRSWRILLIDLLAAAVRSGPYGPSEIGIDLSFEGDTEDIAGPIGGCRGSCEMLVSGEVGAWAFARPKRFE